MQQNNQVFPQICLESSVITTKCLRTLNYINPQKFQRDKLLDEKVSEGL